MWVTASGVGVRLTMSLSCFSPQCQKFGEYHKDDPSSFKFAENFSLYPQVGTSSQLVLSAP